MRWLLFLTVLCLAVPAHAQVSNPPVVYSKAEIDAAVADAKSKADAAKSAADAAAAAATAAASTATAAATTASQAATTASTAATNASSANSAIYAVQAQIPVPRSTAPMSETIGGSAGSTNTYLRGDAQLPRQSRGGVVNTDATGNWSMTFTAATAAVPVVLPIPVNVTTQPVICNVATRTTTGASGRCWLARTLPATIVTLTALLNFDLFGAPAASIPVQIFAIPPTQ